MKKFKFTKQSILNVRTAEKRAAEQNLMNAAGRVRYEEEQFELIKDKFNAARMAEYLPGASFSDFQQYKVNYTELLKQRLKRQELNLKNAQKDYDIAVEKLKIAMIEFKKLENLQEREKESWNKENLRFENILGDEVAQRAKYYAQ